MTEIKKLLPVGSVVRIQGVEKRAVIMGVLPQNEGVVYDYIGVPYPEGFLGMDSMIMFNQDVVELVDYYGRINAEFRDFRAKLEKVMEKH